MKETSCTVIEQIRFLSTAFLRSEFKFENIYSGVKFCEENVCGNSFCVNIFMQIAEKIAKIKTRKNLVPHSIPIINCVTLSLLD